jgi:adenylyltransferase/sulfurtransferase
MAGVVGSIQALEALKLLSGVGEPLLDRILQVDGSAFEWSQQAVNRDPGCAQCGPAPQSG